MVEIAVIAPCDFHLHSSFSVDGSGTLADFCEQAVRYHMKEIGFCEHLDLDPMDPAAGRHDYEAYAAEVERLRQIYAGRLEIRMGVEVGFLPRLRAEIKEFLEAHPYDYVIGSVHILADGQTGISEEEEALETFARREWREAYEEYFELVREMVISGLFDVVGHLDLIQRFGVNYQSEPLEWGQFYGVLRRILEGAIKRQMAVEINTSGLRQPPKSTYPNEALLRLYRELDGELVLLGSDAHEPALLGAGIPAALKLVRDLGLQPVSFVGRLPVPLSLWP